jgi:hypothetical protein
MMPKSTKRVQGVNSINVSFFRLIGPKVRKYFENGKCDG